MPIYEYECRKCGTEFTELVRSDEDKVECPVCMSDSVDKKLSAFASSCDGLSAPSGSGMNCTPFR